MEVCAQGRLSVLSLFKFKAECTYHAPKLGLSAGFSRGTRWEKALQPAHLIVGTDRNGDRCILGAEDGI